MNISVDCSRPGYPVGSNMKLTMKLIDEYIKAFKKIGYGKDKKLNLWCRGSSGAILAGMFALKCENECFICHIKKEKEDSHNGNSQPWSRDAINVVIDDFVSYGHTIKAIVEHIESLNYLALQEWTNYNLELHVLMVLHWEDAPKEITDKFKHKIGKRI